MGLQAELSESILNDLYYTNQSVS